MNTNKFPLICVAEVNTHMVGYAWLLTNSMCTAMYILCIEHIMRTMNTHIVGMVYYNNLCSILILIPLAMFNGEMGLYR